MGYTLDKDQAQPAASSVVCATNESLQPRREDDIGLIKTEVHRITAEEHTRDNRFADAAGNGEASVSPQGEESKGT